MKRPFFLVLALAVVSPSFAIVATTSNSSPGGEDFTWSLVGKMGAGAAVAVGPHTFLTARHFGAANIVMGGVTYTKLNTVEGPVINGVQTDLRIVTVSQTLSNWYTLGTSLNAGDKVTMVGYGDTGVVGPTGDRYTTQSGGGKRRAGTNTVFGTFGTSLGSAHIAYLTNAGDAALAGGDSGGGWFDAAGRLVGINSFTFNDTDWVGGTPAPPAKLPDYGFAKANVNGWAWSGTYSGQHVDVNILPGEAYFGSGAIDVTDIHVREWAYRNGAVPEPGTMAVVGLGVAALIRRRRKA
ncbi:MAG: PEP-CTERM sorting domain-containing protein [Armatimonadetes bacterium]|nr:PEP-CTERM sorting domain-containing protein [Armatimonadota bacterium]